MLSLDDRRVLSLTAGTVLQLEKCADVDAIA